MELREQLLLNKRRLNALNIVNLTRHDVTVFLDDDQTLVFSPSGIIAKVEATESPLGDVNRIPITKSSFEDIKNLPEEKENTIYIVPALVLTANAESTKPRTDLISPSTGPFETVRDRNGQIIGVKTFTTR